MKAILLAGVMALPNSMIGAWIPDYARNDMTNFTRLPHDQYEWVIKSDGWWEWDGNCKIHDAKEIDVNDYEVWATCIIGNEPSLDPPWETHKEFKLCGNVLNIQAYPIKYPKSCKPEEIPTS